MTDDKSITDAEIAEWLARNAATPLHGQSPLMARLYRAVRRLRADLANTHLDILEYEAALATEKARADKAEAAAGTMRSAFAIANATEEYLEGGKQWIIGRALASDIGTKAQVVIETARELRDLHENPSEHFRTTMKEGCWRRLRDALAALDGGK